MKNILTPLTATVTAHLIKDAGKFPNNERIPLLIYREVFSSKENPESLASSFEIIYEQNEFIPKWRYGVYPYNHYHSITHEILGVFRGNATLQFGGDEGIKTDVSAGDMIVIPAGVAHRSISTEGDFCCVGGYPSFAPTYDMNYGKDGERPKVDRNIEKVPLPHFDPIYGRDGPLIKYWRQM